MLRDKLWLITNQTVVPKTYELVKLSGDTDVVDLDMIKADDGSILLCGYKYAGATANTVGIIKRSTDGGVTWNTVWTVTDTAHYATRYKLIKLATGKILAVGSIGVGSLIVESTDNGATFSSSSASLPAIFTAGSVIIYPTLYGAVVTATGAILISGMSTYSLGCIMRSTDNGASFSAVYTNEVNRMIGALTKIGSVIYAVAWNSNGVLSKLLKSDDDGQSWSVVSTLLYHGRCDGIVYVSGVLYVLGDSSYAQKSIDGGLSWVAVTHNITSLTFYDNLLFSSISHAGYLYKSETSNINTTIAMYTNTQNIIVDNAYLLGSTLYLPSWSFTSGGTTNRHMYKIEL